MKVLVTGADGMLGREVVGKIPGSVGHNHRMCDITDRYDISRSILDTTPDVIINCAGVVKGMDLPISSYINVNSLGPHLLAERCSVEGIRLINISTDCVFSGRKLYPD